MQAAVNIELMRLLTGGGERAYSYEGGGAERRSWGCTSNVQEKIKHELKFQDYTEITWVVFFLGGGKG